MADHFKGGALIDIQPGATNVPIWLRFPAASGSTKNDGALPYGSTLNDVTITAHHGESSASSTELVYSVSVSSQAASAYLTYSTALSTGIYHLEADVKFSISGTTLFGHKIFDLHRIRVRDL